jgi:hypothetical protein
MVSAVLLPTKTVQLRTGIARSRSSIPLVRSLAIPTAEFEAFAITTIARMAGVR